MHHYLSVSVSGTSVTITPTDELGRTFDPVTYNAPALNANLSLTNVDSPDPVLVGQQVTYNLAVGNSRPTRGDRNGGHRDTAGRHDLRLGDAVTGHLRRRRQYRHAASSARSATGATPTFRSRAAPVGRDISSSATVASNVNRPDDEQQHRGRRDDRQPMPPTSRSRTPTPPDPLPSAHS